MNFDHKELNRIFKFQKGRQIPFIYFENPFVQVEKLKKEYSFMYGTA